MPTPGGSGHGGFGGGGGGFHGGGFGGGGGFRRGPRMGGFWLFGPRFYYGGGCLSWILGPIIMLIVLVVLIIAILVSLISSIWNKPIAYSESAFEKYLYKIYDEEFLGNEEFPNKDGYEDKIVLAVLTYDDYEEYRYLAMTGNDLPLEVYSAMRGDRNSALARAMSNNMAGPSGYEKKLGRNLQGVVNDLTSAIGEVTFSCSETHISGESHLRNDSTLSIDETLVNNALAQFTEKTGVEMVIVVDEAVDVFGYRSPVARIVALIVLLAISGFVIYLIVRNTKAKKHGNNGNNNGNSNGGGTSFNGNPRTDSGSYDRNNW